MSNIILVSICRDNLKCNALALHIIIQIVSSFFKSTTVFQDIPILYFKVVLIKKTAVASLSPIAMQQ